MKLICKRITRGYQLLFLEPIALFVRPPMVPALAHQVLYYVQGHLIE